MFCLIPLSASVFFELLYGISVSVEYFYKKAWNITLGTIITVGLNIGLDILFVYYWGYIAAAYATVISKAFLFIFHFIISKRIDKNQMFSLPLVLLLTIVIAGAAAGSIFLADVFWARLVIALVLLALLILWFIKNKTLIKSVFSSKKEEKVLCEE